MAVLRSDIYFFLRTLSLAELQIANRVIRLMTSIYSLAADLYRGLRCV